MKCDSFKALDTKIQDLRKKYSFLVPYYLIWLWPGMWMCVTWWHPDTLSVSPVSIWASGCDVLIDIHCVYNILPKISSNMVVSHHNTQTLWN